MPELYTPPDVDTASEAWGANCGPGALAAAFERPVMSVFDAVAEVPSKCEQLALVPPPARYRGYMGITQLQRAIVALGGRVGHVWRPFDPTHVGPDHPVRRCPEGVLLVMVDWLGPWSGTRGQAAHRHVVAFRVGMFNPTWALRLIAGDRSPLDGRSDLVGPLWVFDVNYGWAPLDVWSTHLAPRLMPARATSWRMSWAGEVAGTP